MAEQLQGLLDRIQREGVDKAKAEADRIVDEARRKAAAIVAEAEAKADAHRRQAERDGATFAERGEKALKQAARDVVLSLGESINRTVQALVRQDVGEALSADKLAGIIANVAQAYTRQEGRSGGVSVLVPEAEQQQIVAHVRARLGDAALQGLDIVGDGRVIGGFRVAIKDENVEHDFTKEAITMALSQLLRPHIAGIVQEATQGA